MRLWLSRKSPVSMREQIATQMMLGVISEDPERGITEFAKPVGVVAATRLSEQVKQAAANHSRASAFLPGIQLLP